MHFPRWLVGGCHIEIFCHKLYGAIWRLFDFIIQCYSSLHRVRLILLKPVLTPHRFHGFALRALALRAASVHRPRNSEPTRGFSPQGGSIGSVELEQMFE